MISQKWAKLLRSLQQKKYRKIEQLFVVEGEKAVLELLQSDWQVKALFATDSFLEQHAQYTQKAALVQQASPAELAQVGSFQTNDAAVAAVEIPADTGFLESEGDWVLVLDQINDPGNLGAMIRIADWYGIRHILCSSDTVDLYNPKVIAAAKGSFLRVQLHYGDLSGWLGQTRLPVFGAYLQGENIHQLALQQQGGYLVMGNEANGISAGLAPLISRKVTIPAFGQTESLNVAMATAVLVDNLKRLSAVRS
ncbi:RNA methyltransferase [Rheinheimera sp.]|uniref:TrmH family RNA methyltransferase n=1 Tax=Rheinheimera sp. TaxID=1869214 RepID=UPI00307EACCC